MARNLTLVATATAMFFSLSDQRSATVHGARMSRASLACASGSMVA